MVEKDIQIINKLGLHARASSKFTQLAGKFKSEIWISRSNRRVNAKSIMGVMMLAAAKGSTVHVEASGPDESDALSALEVLINNRFDESE
ncbi:MULTISPECIES: HPr family phosphocarrier protein [Microvirgula]|uniref:HPr family phosphocarrier protein n=1 Tax=Microvirgula aerodenitrificans TaxID=57480 RepID=A0A2S0P9T1_9NEIS|nr:MULTISPECIES: HPr family phosphocarrier protein [Microvirgula]AVY94150.1 HPr family phosphocarrier protein [Microvirgula aerodenitrificans]RAS15592.1 phosphocarrier protein [Microvirgula sp. AG722]